jgi:L-ribulose-5-phosphate 3-epimerase
VPSAAEPFPSAEETPLPGGWKSQAAPAKLEPMRLGYNTNGMAHHELCQAIELLAEIGYRSVAITLDHGTLDPFDKPSSLSGRARDVRSLLERRQLHSVVETGARFLLDPRQKHEPTLVTADPQAAARRIDFLCRAIDVAKALESDCVSLWSGVLRDRAPWNQALARLIDRLQPVLEHADEQGVNLGFEPEPGMLIDTMDKFDELAARIDSPRLHLTLDIGHLHCQRETPLPDYIRRYGPRLVNVHLEDMRSGAHEHLMFGEGEIDFPSVIDALAEVGYEGGVHVELSRHSHEGPTAARRAFDFLQPLFAGR